MSILNMRLSRIVSTNTKYLHKEGHCMPFRNKINKMGTFLFAFGLDTRSDTNSQVFSKSPKTFLLARFKMGDKESNESGYFLPTNGTRQDVLKEETQISLPYFQSTLFATVLEDSVFEMRILVECNNELHVAKTMYDIRSLMALKYEVAQPEVTDELDGIDQKRLGCDEYKLKKLDKDRKYITEAITNTYIHLVRNKRFEALENIVNKVVNLDKYHIEVFEDEAKNRVLHRDLSRQIRQQRNHIKSVIYDTDTTIDELRAEFEDGSLNAEMRSRYVQQWQLSRTEQHLQKIHDVESTPTSIIEYYKQRADSEQRVHNEVELLVNITINETLQKIEHWMNKYDRDMEAIDLKIQMKKNDYQNMLDKRINLEETMETHDKAMKQWIHFKEEREKARLYKEKMNNSAITVQAWWRGLLVRKQLGPYKVVTKKGGAKNKVAKYK